jgi:triosephosphate isomerase (TIM)
MRPKIVAGNWKMNYTLTEGIQFINELNELLKSKSSYKAKIIIIPPFIHLYEMVKTFGRSFLNFGAQNLYEKEKGAYTGEISAAMIKSVGAGYVCVGHSERRQYFAETNTQLATKVELALKNNLCPIYCCGETLDQRNNKVLFEIIKEQIEVGLFSLSAEDFQKIIIAYEPVWAIGTGVVATPAQAQEMHAFIRGLIIKKYGNDIAGQTPILYGGSVKASNAAELFMLPDVDGGLVGGASLISTEFYDIINAC